MPQDFERLENHIDGKFDDVKELLSEIKLATNENTKNIIQLQSQYKAISDEFAQWKYSEQSQHKEFYQRITDVEQSTVKDIEHKQCSGKLNDKMSDQSDRIKQLEIDNINKQEYKEVTDFIVSQRTTNKIIYTTIVLTITIAGLIAKFL